jgi:uncharacterized protein (UPF0335 family)
MSDNISKSSVSKEQLQKIIEKIEKLDEEKANIMEDIKEVFKEARYQGFEVSILKKIIRLRKMDNTKLEEEDYLIDLYRKILGI